MYLWDSTLLTADVTECSSMTQTGWTGSVLTSLDSEIICVLIQNRRATVLLCGTRVGLV